MFNNHRQLGFRRLPGRAAPGFSATAAAACWLALSLCTGPAGAAPVAATSAQAARASQAAAAAAAAAAVPVAQVVAPMAAQAVSAALIDLGQALLPTSGPGGVDMNVNALVSPVATVMALGLLQAGVAGQTDAELLALLLPPPRNLGATASHAFARQAWRSTLPALLRPWQGKAAPDSALALATRLWVDNSAAPQLSVGYRQRVKQRWQAQAQALYFSDGEAARQTVNSWTAEHTAGRITDLLPAGSVSAATRLTLTSALHFRSPWAQPFDAAQTEGRPFRRADGSLAQVPTMVAERSLMQARIDGLRVMELPFHEGSGGGFSLLLVLADAEGAAAATAQASPLLEGSRLARWRAALQPLRCELSLPQFNIKPQSRSLKPALQALGLKTAFSDRADLRPMLGRAAAGLHLDDVIQSAGMQIDETGGEAVAAAAATLRAKSLSLPLPACAVDRAFAFAVLHQATGLPLFVGRVGDPGAAR